jgi:hypothetical protein
MKAKKETRVSAIITAVAVCLLGESLWQAQAQTWNVINETYGNGQGEVSFNASYAYAFGSTAPPETLSPGKATLNLPQGTNPRYPVKLPNSLPAWAGGGSDVTLEWKIAYKDGASGAIYLAETQSTASSSWGHILLFNRHYNGLYQASVIEDYCAYNAVNLAPAGFDGSLPHVYRLVRQGGVDSWYVDGQLVKQAVVICGKRGKGSGRQFDCCQHAGDRYEYAPVGCHEREVRQRPG